MKAFYNEIDAYCCDWLSNLMDAGHITPGVICDKSIEDLLPDDLRGFDRVHMFAGLGGWDYALNLAGWTDREVWTGSCPCQPFSAAGKGAGFADERHLWPAWQHLINQCRPTVIFGEQVASKAVDAWIDLVHADMEGMGYAFGCVPFPSAGVGAPHIRDRTYWLADATSGGRRKERADGGRIGARDSAQGIAAGLEHGGECGGVADSANERLDGRRANEAGDGRDAARIEPQRLCDAGERPGPTNGFWRSADWLGCTDGKWRPAQARVQQMVNGHPLRVGSMCTVLSEKVEEVMNEAAQRLQTETDALLREVRDCIGSEDIFRWRGGAFGVHEAQILLAYLFQYTGQERCEPNSADGPGTRPSVERDVRVLWRQGASCDPSRQRGLAGWPLGELADTLRTLSSAVARFASEAGYPNLYADAAASFPLGEVLYPDQLGQLRPKARAARLKGYGNAINAQAAQAFIESYCEARGLIARRQS